MVTIVLAALALAQQSPQLPAPKFETGVDVVLVDVHVVDRSGKPVLDLKPEEFEVHISGDRRKVANAQLMTYALPPKNTGAAPSEPAAGEVPRPRRMFVLAVDEHSLHPGSALAAVAAAEKFIDKLQPDDLVGLYAYPTGTAQHDLTDDHASVRRVLQKITGLFDEPGGRFNLTPSEVIDIASGDMEAARRVMVRECRGVGQPGCTQKDIQNDAIGMAGFMEMKVSQSVGGLRGLIRGLRDVPGRKILVLVSGGLVFSDRSGGRAQSGGEIAAVGRDAALANLSVFALHLDWSFVQAQVSRGGVRSSYFRDANLAATGLERVAGEAGGTVMRVLGGNPDVAFDRVLSETSAHYVLGVEGRDDDRDGNPKTIRVSVKRRGVQVRSRTQFVWKGQPVAR
jgi:VWFA-related protein